MERRATPRHPGTCERGEDLCLTLSFIGGFTRQMFIVARLCFRSGRFGHYWVMITLQRFPNVAFYPRIVSTRLLERFAFPHTSPVPPPHICCLWSTGSTRFPHAFTLSAKSFIKCSGCYDNYECGAERYIRIWSSSCTVAHLPSFNAMVIMQAILGKQLKQRPVLKDQ